MGRVREGVSVGDKLSFESWVGVGRAEDLEVRDRKGSAVSGSRANLKDQSAVKSRNGEVDGVRGLQPIFYWTCDYRDSRVNCHTLS